MLIENMRKIKYLKIECTRYDRYIRIPIYCVTQFLQAEHQMSSGAHNPFVN